MKAQALSEPQWKIIEKYLENYNRKRKYELRLIFEALFYVLVTGCQWRMLPYNFPKWQLVYYYFSKWRDEEMFVYLNDMVREYVRQSNGKNARCSVGIIDSQSVKTTRRGGLRGIDGNKRIKGRKRHIVVDTMGNIVSNIVHVANIHDSKGAHLVMRNLKENTFGIRTIYADNGYRGSLIEAAKQKYDYELKISPKIKDNSKGKWFENFRRLSKDFEYLLESSQAMLYLASLKFLLNKI